MYSWHIDLSTARLDDIFEIAQRLQRIDRMTFVIPVRGTRGGWLPRSRITANLVMRHFGDSILDVFLALGWPGSEYTDHPGLVCLLKLTSASAPRMLALAPVLSEWRFGAATPLPEDVCLFNSTANFPAFLSTTHESDGWFLTDKRLRSRNARLQKVTPEEMLIFPGKAFCKPWRSPRLPSWARDLSKVSTERGA